MIEVDTLKFGYGDIYVKASIIRLIFQQISPPINIGEKIADYSKVIFDDNKVVISLDNYEEYKELSSKLKEVLTGNTRTFRFKNYVFDFTNFKEESVRVCENAVKVVGNNMMICLAC